MEAPGSTESDRPNGYGATLSIGGMILQILGCYDDGIGPIRYHLPIDGLAVQIWPLTGGYVRTPSVTLDRQGLLYFANSFVTPPATSV
jgi:hypothetical protein